jgi:NAD(P)-dependent dehydrogenase (short-subunit alcohol dehydrogenase family)
MASSKDVRAVVTGAGSGLGRAFAVELASRGALVLVSDLDAGRAEQTASEIMASGGRALSFACDVTDLDAVQRLAGEADERMGGVDLLINNAGVAVGGPMEDIPIEDWRWVVDVNLWGVVHGCHVFYPRMKAQGSGTILNVASAAGLLAPPELGPYNVTKAAVIALSETLHAEGKPHGVQVTVLCPTFFKTGIMDAARGPIDHASKALVAKLMERSPLQASDVARHALAACDHGRLYAVPMMDGKLFWVLKRLLPGSFYGVTGLVQRAVRAGMGR